MKVDPKLIAEMEKKGLIPKAAPCTVIRDLQVSLREAWDEKTFTKEVIALAQSHGWHCAHFRTSQGKAGRWLTAVQGDGKGFFDLVLARERCLFAELKVGKNKRTKEQEQWAEVMNTAGQLVYLWKPQDWPQIVEVLT